MRSRVRGAETWGLVALIVLLSGAIAATGGQSPLDAPGVAHAAPATSQYVPRALSVDDCVEELTDDTLPPAST